MEEKKPTPIAPINITEILADDSVPGYYANSFACFRGNADVGVAFQKNGKSAAIVNMSFTMAKTLAQKLQELISDFEETVSTEILTTGMVDLKTHTKRKENKNDIN